MSVNVMKLLLMLALICTPAWGQTLRMTNNGGGEIVLTKRWCTYDGKEYRPLLEAYSYHRTGKMSQGCWEQVDSMIRIHWFDQNGIDTRTYPADSWRYVE